MNDSVMGYFKGLCRSSVFEKYSGLFLEGLGIEKEKLKYTAL